MAVIQNDKKELLKKFDERRAREFLVVSPQVGDKVSTVSVKPSEERAKDWIKAFEKSKIQVTDWNIEDKDVVVFRFENGLKISDYGYHVSFSATEDKDKVKMNSAFKVVDCAANHLRHTGWDGFAIVELRPSGLAFLSAFSYAYELSSQKMFQKLWVHSARGKGSK